MTIAYPIKTAIIIPAKKPKYEKLPVILKLPIRNKAVSKPSLNMAKKTTRKTPQPEVLIAF
jgi:hypothetical protein